MWKWLIELTQARTGNRRAGGRRGGAHRLGAWDGPVYRPSLPAIQAANTATPTASISQRDTEVFPAV